MDESIQNVEAALWSSFLILFCPLCLGIFSINDMSWYRNSFFINWIISLPKHAQHSGTRISNHIHVIFVNALSYLYLSFLSYIGKHCFTAVSPLLEGPSYKDCPQQVLSEGTTMFLIILLGFPHSQLSKEIVSPPPECEYLDYFRADCI